MKSLKVFAPATVSNVGPGFDLMGFALEEPGDVMTIRENSKGMLRLFNKTDFAIPLLPEKNVSSVAIRSILNKIDTQTGLDIIFEKKIKPGSGIGSSAASSAAAVKGVNELWKLGFSDHELIHFALKGEFIASKSMHADNIAPALLGGIILIRSYDPIDIIELKSPRDLWCSVVHPDIEIKTAESRKNIPQLIPLKDTLAQAGNLASLVNGILTSDYNIIGRSLSDKIAEPVRNMGITGYVELKARMQKENILGINISGSGPAIFCLCNSESAAEDASQKMKDFYTGLNIRADSYYSQISTTGAKIIG